MVLSACVRLQLYIILCFSLLGKVIGALRKNSSVLPCRHFLSQRVSCLSFQASSLFSSRCCVQFSVLVQTPLDRDCFSSVANKKALQKFLSHSSGVAIDRRYHPITIEGREFLSGATVLQGRAGRGGEVGVAALVGSYGTKKKEGYVWGRRFEFSIFFAVVSLTPSPADNLKPPILFQNNLPLPTRISPSLGEKCTCTFPAAYNKHLSLSTCPFFPFQSQS